LSHPLDGVKVDRDTPTTGSLGYDLADGEHPLAADADEENVKRET